MAPQFGRPVKAVALRAGDRVSRGEFVISARGIEGGAVYALADRLREGVPLLLDLAPDLGLEEVRARLSRRRRGDSLASHLRKALKFDPVLRHAAAFAVAHLLPRGNKGLLLHTQRTQFCRCLSPCFSTDCVRSVI